MTIKVIDNFLPIQEYKPIYNLITSDTFPWFISNFKVNEGDGILQLNHYFYNGITTQSPVLKILEPIYLKLKIIAPIRIKANCTFGQPNKIQTNFHIDGSTLNTTSRKSAIFYLSDTNGQTLFKDKKEEIECKQNRLIIFDSYHEHAAVLHKGEFNTRRIVINFNYF